MTKLRGVSKLVLGHLSSRCLVSQNLLVWSSGLSQGFSVLSPPTSRSCPRRALTEGFESSSGQPREDGRRVGFDGLSCPGPACCWSSGSQASKEAGPFSIHSFAITLRIGGSSGLQSKLYNEPMQASWSRLISLALRKDTHLTRQQLRSGR